MSRRPNVPRPVDFSPPAPAPAAEPPEETPHRADPSLASVRLWIRVALALLFPGVVFAAAARLFPTLRDWGAQVACPLSWTGFLEAAFAPYPGGALRWCAAYLAACWAHPWLGWALFLALGGLSILLGRLAHLPLWGAPLPFAATIWGVAAHALVGWEPITPFLLIAGGVGFALLLMLTQCLGAWAVIPLCLAYPALGTPALLAAALAVLLPRPGPGARLMLAATLALPVAWRWAFPGAEWLPILTANAPFLPSAPIWNGIVAGVLVLMMASAWQIPLFTVLRLPLWVPTATFLGAIWRFLPQ